MANEDEQTMAIPQEGNLGEILSKSKRVGGKTRCIKLHKDVAEYGIKHMIEFDDMGNFKGKHRSEISSFLGSLVRKEVGLKELRWKKVSKQVKDTMWEIVTVRSTCLFIQCKYYSNCLFVY